MSKFKIGDVIRRKDEYTDNFYDKRILKIENNHYFWEYVEGNTEGTWKSFVDIESKHDLMPFYNTKLGRKLLDKQSVDIFEPIVPLKRKLFMVGTPKE